MDLSTLAFISQSVCTCALNLKNVWNQIHKRHNIYRFFYSSLRPYGRGQLFKYSGLEYPLWIY